MTKFLIALDLDGTTLNDQSRISLRTQRTLNKLAKMGNVVSIITGRPFRISHQYYFVGQLLGLYVQVEDTSVGIDD